MEPFWVCRKKFTKHLKVRILFIPFLPSPSFPLHYPFFLPLLLPPLLPLPFLSFPPSLPPSPPPSLPPSPIPLFPSFPSSLPPPSPPYHHHHHHHYNCLFFKTPLVLEISLDECLTSLRLYDFLWEQDLHITCERIMEGASQADCYEHVEKYLDIENKVCQCSLKEVVMHGYRVDT